MIVTNNTNNYFIHLLTFFFYIDLKMFTETVPSRCIAMVSKAASIERKKQNSIKMMQISMRYTCFFFPYKLQITKT